MRWYSLTLMFMSDNLRAADNHAGKIKRSMKEIPISTLEEMLKSEFISVTQRGEDARRRVDETCHGSQDHGQALRQLNSAFSQQVGLRRIARMIESHSGVRVSIDPAIPSETTRQPQQ